MNTKEYMKMAKTLIRRINRKYREADTIREQLSAPKSPSFSDMPKTVSPQHNSMEVGIARIMELENEAVAAEKELETLKSVFHTEISNIANPEYRDILIKRYLEFKVWNIIAAEMGYSTQHIYRLHTKAIEKLRVNESS
ncbi:MAG: hypothetical protein IJN43_08945 [Ruminococcus sp.]|nr:hypothetical protein [Ruminococcus sp.]